MSRNTIAAVAAADLLRIEGADRVDLLHRLSTNDLTPLSEPGRAVSTVFTTAQGRIVDWVRLIAATDHLLAIASPGRAARLAEWIDGYTIMEEVHCLDVTADWSLVVLDGPAAARAVGLSRPPASGFAEAADGGWWLRGVDAYEARFEGLLPMAQVPVALERALAAGAVEGGETDLEQRRLLAGVPSPNAEYAGDVNPLELRLARHAISFTKGCYIGQEVISRLDSYDKLSRVLVGFEVDDSIGAVLPLTVVRDGKTLGRVTSIGPGPSGVLGLAVVRRSAAEPGPAHLRTPGGDVPVRIVDRPFWA
jgi:folate-binding protein YgfZ